MRVALGEIAVVTGAVRLTLEAALTHYLTPLVSAPGALVTRAKSVSFGSSGRWSMCAVHPFLLMAGAAACRDVVQDGLA